MQSFATPDWVKNAVFYQIFPDRFARGSRAHHVRGIKLKPWGSDPKEQGYQGGDLYGVADKLDYLKQLGVNAIYLNPIFASASNHRYHTYDYFEVDPLLGGNEALRFLLDQAHARNIKVVLDGVFNHASRGFWAFHHILENGPESPYLDWFIVHDWPLRPYHSGKRRPANYEAWWGLPALPKFNIKNPGVRDYLLSVAKHWLEFGIDGWRLDVPEEIDDPIFWRSFRDTVKAVNPDAYICGEIWDKAQAWLSGDRFDAVMNYTFAWSSMSYFGADSVRKDYDKNHMPLKPLSTTAFRQIIDDMHSWYCWDVNQVQLNLLDSHDTARALWILQENKLALRMCVLFQMTMPGAPCIYYGSEVGVTGGDDPMCREAYPWHEPRLQDKELLAFYQRACALRNQHPVLRTGSFELLDAGEEVLAFRRQLKKQEAYVLFNRGDAPQSCELTVKPGAAFDVAWPAPDTIACTSEALQLTLEPGQTLVLIRSQ